MQEAGLEVGHENAAGVIRGRESSFLPADMIISTKCL